MDASATDEIGQTALHYAAKGGHVDTIVHLVGNHGLDASATDEDGRSALDVAEDEAWHDAEDENEGCFECASVLWRHVSARASRP